MISGKTKLIGIVGYPVEHSISPAIHNAAFAALGLDYSYVPLPVNPANLCAAITGIKALGFCGINVTIPHKVEVMSYLDEIDSIAREIGAVNTVVVSDNKCIGYNTDADGFIKSLELNNIAIKQKNAVLLGAGGAARAIVCGLLQHGISRITIAARSREKAETFANSFKKSMITGIAWTDLDTSSVLQTCHILVNCTPIGMYPLVGNEPSVNWDNLNRNATVCDLIYNPLPTKFLTTAARLGHTTLSGEGMLIEQAAAAFKLWTGKYAPRVVMYETFKNTLY